MSNFYNDSDPFVCAWLRELIKANLIAPGVVDERSILEIKAEELRQFTQCHFFAGIGGWSLALRLAGWPDTEPVWTGSCPCQPLSCAGQRKGHADERHLWPAFHALIAQCRPATVFGEQVASADGREWLAGVRADLEGMGYAVGAADLCAAGVGAPHRRQRIYWVAGGSRQDGTRARAQGTGRKEFRPVNCGATGELADAGLQRQQHAPEQEGRDDAGRGESRQLADADGGQSGDGGLQRGGRFVQQSQDETASGLGQSNSAGPQSRGQTAEANGHGRSAESAGGAGGPAWIHCPCCDDFWCRIHYCHTGECDCPEIDDWTIDPYTAGGPVSVADDQRAGLEGHAGNGNDGNEPGRFRAGTPRPVAASGATGFWTAYDLIPCLDGKARRIEPGTFPLAHGVPARVGRLRGYGNAIVQQVAAQFIAAFGEAVKAVKPQMNADEREDRRAT